MIVQISHLSDTRKQSLDTSGPTEFLSPARKQVQQTTCMDPVGGRCVSPIPVTLPIKMESLGAHASI